MKSHAFFGMQASLRCIAAFVTAFVACITAVRADVGERVVLDIRLRIDPSLVTMRVAEALKAETEKIWAPYGVRLHWTDADDSRLGSVSLDAALVRQSHRHQRIDRPAVLGTVLLGPDAPAWRPICISFDATQRSLAARTMTGRVAGAGVVLHRELSRALGRVLAHEIGHVLTGAAHDRSGLMRAILDPDELAGLDTTPFRLTPSSVDRLESGLRALMGSTHLNQEQHAHPLAVEAVPATSPCLADQPTR